MAVPFRDLEPEAAVPKADARLPLGSGVQNVAPVLLQDGQPATRLQHSPDLGDRAQCIWPVHALQGAADRRSVEIAVTEGKGLKPARFEGHIREPKAPSIGARCRDHVRRCVQPHHRAGTFREVKRWQPLTTADIENPSTALESANEELSRLPSAPGEISNLSGEREPAASTFSLKNSHISILRGRIRSGMACYSFAASLP